MITNRTIFLIVAAFAGIGIMITGLAVPNGLIAGGGFVFAALSLLLIDD